MCYRQGDLNKVLDTVPKEVWEAKAFVGGELSKVHTSGGWSKILRPRLLVRISKIGIKIDGYENTIRKVLKLTVDGAKKVLLFLSSGSCQKPAPGGSGSKRLKLRNTVVY